MRREFSTPSPPQLSICESSLSFLLYSCFLCFYTPLPSYPFSFHTLAHSLAHSKTQLLSFQWVSHSLPRNSRVAGAHSLCQMLQCFSAHLRLFGSFPRIPVRMSATISCLTSQLSRLLGSP